MYGVTQQYITSAFAGQPDVKILTLLRTSDSTIKKVSYKATIQMPKRTLTGVFVCKAFEDASKSNKGHNFTATFSYGNVEVKLDSDEDFNKLFKFLSKVSNEAGNVGSVQLKCKDIYAEIEKESKVVEKEIKVEKATKTAAI